MADPQVPATPEPIAPVDANAAPATPAPAQPDTNAKKWKLPVNGKEIEYDASDENRLKADIQKALAADSKFQEAAAMRKQVEAVIQALKASPGKALLNPALGHKPTEAIKSVIQAALEAGHSVKEIKDFLSEQMYEWIQEENMDPRERRVKELERQLAKQEEEKKAQAEAERAAALEKLTAEHRQKLETDLVDALKESGLPKSTFVVKRMAYYYDQALKMQKAYADKGITIRAPGFKDVVPLVRKEIESYFKDLYSTADADTLMGLIGDEGMKRVRQRDVERLRAGGAPAPTAPTPAPQRAAVQPSKAKPSGKSNFFRDVEARIRKLEEEGR